MKPKKMKAYSSFADWKDDQSSEHRKLIESLARLVRKTAPELTTGVKWGQGCWLADGVPKVYIHAEPDHLQFGFYAGATLEDPERILTGSGKYVRHVKVWAGRPIPRKALVALIEQIR